MLVDYHKPRDEAKRLTKKQMKEACKDPMLQTKIKLRSKWKAPIKYRVLQVFQLNEVDRREVAKIMVQSVTPDEAKQATFLKPFWSYRDISLVKDFECGILCFKGLAVCLFYKRQCYEVEPVATDPVPIGALENEDDIWARLDLFSKSPRELHATVRPELLELSMQATELKHRLNMRDIEVNSLQKQVRNQNIVIVDLEAKLKEVKAKLSQTDKERVKDLARRLKPSTKSNKRKEQAYAS